MNIIIVLITCYLLLSCLLVLCLPLVIRREPYKTRWEMLVNALLNWFQ